MLNYSVAELRENINFNMAEFVLMQFNINMIKERVYGK